MSRSDDASQVPEEHPSTRLRERIPSALVVLTVLIILLHATQWGLVPQGADKASPAESVKTGLALRVHALLSRVTPAEPLVLIAFVLWIVDTVLKRDWRRPLALSLPAVLFIAWAGLSLIPALKGRQAASFTLASREGLINIGQLIEYFVAAYLVFVYVLRRDRGLHVAMIALFVAVSATLAFAGVQYLQPADEVPAWRVCAAFGNRNVLAAFLALTVPLVSGYALGSGRWGLRLWALVLAVAALCLVTAGGQFAALVIGLAAAAGIFRRWLVGPVLLVAAVLWLVVFPHYLPRRNDGLLLESVMPYRTTDEAGALGDRFDEAAGMAQARQRNLASLMALLYRRSPLDRDALKRLVGDLPGEAEHSWRWQQRYREWQAAANMALASPLLGVGVGGYQVNVNAHYAGAFPLPAKMGGVNLMEEDALSMYAVWTACLGVLLFLWLLLDHGIRAGRGLVAESAERRGAALGALCAVLALAVSGVFTDFLVRGLGITLALVLAVAASASRPPAPSPARGSDEESK